MCLPMVGKEDVGVDLTVREKLEGAKLNLQSTEFQDRSYYCVLTPFTGTLSLAETTQPIFIESYEGQEVNIPCNHTGITINEYVYWYRQFPQKGPQFVI